MSAVIGRIKNDHDSLNKLLGKTEPSLALSAGNLLAKSLLIAGASELETELTRILSDFFEEASNGSTMVVEFARRKGINRQYHTFFQWDSNNGNSFYSLFGPDFKTAMIAQVNSDANLNNWVQDFLKLGDLRNQLVHENFAAFSLNNTVDEIFSIYENAERFCQALPTLLRTLIPQHAGIYSLP